MARYLDADRRAFLATVGTAGIPGMAGCPDFDGDGDDGGTENDEDDGDRTDVVVPATASHFPPFEYIESGQLMGLDVDLVEAVIDRAGYEVGAWVDIRFDALLGELNAEQFDVVAAATTIGLGRTEQIAFSTPYQETDQSVLVGSDEGFRPEEASDLEGRLVGAQRSTSGEARAMRLVEAGVLDESDYRQFVDYVGAIDALEAGTIDAVVVDTHAGDAFASTRDVRTAFAFETDEEYGLAMRQDDDRRTDIDEAMASILDDGTYDALVEEHLA